MRNIVIDMKIIYNSFFYYIIDGIPIFVPKLLKYFPNLLYTTLLLKVLAELFEAFGFQRKLTRIFCRIQQRY